MASGKNAALLAMFLAVAFSVAMPTMSSPGVGGYDFWLDVNDDGQINIIDVAAVATAFRTSGQNMTKAFMQYDSGWINLTGQTSQNYTLMHNLDLTSSDMIVDARQETQAWGRLYGWIEDEGAWSLIQTSDGGYAVAGYTHSFGKGGFDAYLIKTDASGPMLWNKTYGGTDLDYVRSIIQTSEGGYVLAGGTVSFGAGGADMYLVKTDASGAMLWNKTYGGTNYEEAFSLVQTVDGGYAFAGYTRSFGEGVFSDVYLVKTDANGVVQWNMTYGGKSGDDQATFLIQTSDGGYALAGATLTSFSAGGADMYLVKTDASGAMLWNKTYGGTEWDEAFSLVQTGDGGYALAGYTLSFGAGGRDAYLVKTDASGAMLWNKTYGGTGAEEAVSLVQTGDGGYALAGYTLSFGAGGGDMYLVKTDASGNFLWGRTYGKTGTDVAASLIRTGDGGYAFAGYTTLGLGGSADVSLFKTEGESGLDWIPSTVDSITLVRDAATPWSCVRVQIWKKR